MSPAASGRFPIISGIRFAFDNGKEINSRIDVSSLYVKNKPIDLNEVFIYGILIILN